MQIRPPEITYRDWEKTDVIDSLIREKIAKLKQFCDYINSCRVVVEKAHKHPDKVTSVNRI